jgi:heterodisulfide reductase subunit A
MKKPFRMSAAGQVSIIGGHMLQFDKTFPTLDCAACIGTPKMVDVGQHPDIELLSYSEVTDVSGYIGNYKVTVLKKPRYIKEDACTGCGQCAENCPVTMCQACGMSVSAHEKQFTGVFPSRFPSHFALIKKTRPRAWLPVLPMPMYRAMSS